MIQIVNGVCEVCCRPPCQLDALGLAPELVRARGLEERLVGDRVVEHHAVRPEVERRVGEEESVRGVPVDGAVVGAGRRLERKLRNAVLVGVGLE